MLSASPVQVVATQLTHWPPCTTPTLKVQSSVVMSSISMILRAMARIAERPSASREPAWLGRPTDFEVEARDRVAAADHAAVGAAGSGTST